MSSKIEWTEDTWNPIIGCDKVSEGCKNCYAIQTAWIRMHNEKMKEKYAGTVEKTAGGKLNWTGKISMHEPSLLKPLKTKKPTTFFVNSMSDLFHKDVPFSFIDKVFAVMALTPQHTYQVLTKRADRMVEYFQRRQDSEMFEKQAELIMYDHREFVFEMYKDSEFGKMATNKLLPHLKDAGWYYDSFLVDENEHETEFIYEGKFPLSNVWLGVSVENQKAADERIPKLLQVPAAVRFLSCEPLLGELTLWKYLQPKTLHSYQLHKSLNIPVIDWVIAGGESGKDARPAHPGWARSLRDQCHSAGVAFFFKQWGEYLPLKREEVKKYPLIKLLAVPEHELAYAKVGKNKAGRELDGQTYDEFPIITKEVLDQF